MQNSVLILDDVKSIRADLSKFLGIEGYAVHTAETKNDAEKIIKTENIDFAIIDLKIDYHSEFSGTQVINFIKRNQPQTKVIVLSAHSIKDEEIQSKIEVDIDGYIDKGGQINYIDAVINRLNELINKPAPKKCFVIMPFSSTLTCSEDEWTDIYENIFKPAIEDSGCNYICKRSEVLSGGCIIDGIFDDLNSANIVIADLTDKNPNVFYELGARHALRNNTLLVSQNMKFIPHDLQSLRVLVYDKKTEKSRNNIRSQINGTIKEIEKSKIEIISPIRRHLELISAHQSAIR